MLVRFILNNGAGLYVINPKTSEIKLSKNRENNAGFLRTRMTGKITLTRGDFDLINNRDFEQRFDIALQRRKLVTDNWQTDCVSSFYKTDCEIDEANKIIDVNTWETKDKYEEILNKANDKKDLIELGVVPYEVDYLKYGVFQVYEKGSSTLTNISNGHYWDSSVFVPINDHDELNRMIFGYDFNKHRRLYASGESANLVPDVSGYWEGEYADAETIAGGVYSNISKGAFSLYRVGDKFGPYTDPNTPNDPDVRFVRVLLTSGTDLYDDWDDFESEWEVNGITLHFLGTWFDGSAHHAVFRNLSGTDIPASGTLTHISGAVNTSDKEYSSIYSNTITTGNFHKWGVLENSTIQYVCESNFHFSDKKYDLTAEKNLYDVKVGGLYKSSIYAGYKTRVEADGGVLYSTKSCTIGSNFTDYQFRIYEKEFYVRYLTDSAELDGKSGIDVSLIEDDIVDGISYQYAYRITLSNNLFFLNDLNTAINPLFGKYPTNAENHAGGNFTPPNSTAVPIAKKDWVGASIWMNFSGQLQSIIEEDKQLITLRDAYKIEDCLNLLIKDIDESITFDISQFIFAENQQANPITGVKNQQLFFTPKSNIVNYTYSKAAGKFELSLNDILLFLKNAMNCQWDITANSMRIEHRRYYRNGGSYSTLQVGKNLEIEINAKNGIKKSYGQNKYTFQKEELPYIIEFGWSDKVSEAFEGYPIEINSKFVNKSTKEDRKINEFVTDLSYVLLQGSEVSLDGAFVLGANMIDSRYVVPFKKVTISGHEWNLNNGYLSNLYLIDKYHRDDLPAPDININTLPTAAESVKRSKIQKMTLPISNIDDNKLIYTANGNGEVETFDVDVFTNEAEIKSRHDNE